MTAILVIILVTLADIMLLIKILAAIMLVNLVVPEGLEPSFPANQAGVLPVRQTVLLYW